MVGDILKIIVDKKTAAQLKPFLNDKGFMEIALRGKNQRFKLFQKVALSDPGQTQTKQQLNEAILSLLKKNNGIAEKTLGTAEKALEGLGNLGKLSSFGLVLGGVNLCATATGFIMMHKELQSIKEEITNMIGMVLAEQKKQETAHTGFEFEKTLSKHVDMMDCRKKQKFYTEEKMQELVSEEYNLLQFLCTAFISNIVQDRETLLRSILSLASMLAVSIEYFDEVYFYSNKEAIKAGSTWHDHHDSWVSVYDQMTSAGFIKKVQDFAFLEQQMGAMETDCFYRSFAEQMKSLKQGIEDNQKLIVAAGNPEILKSLHEQSLKEVREEIEKALSEAGIDASLFEHAINVAVA